MANDVAGSPSGRPDGASRARTGDLLGAIQALSQLSYSPEPASSLAGRCGGRALRAVHQLAVADGALHVLRLLAIPAPVLELDRRIALLSGSADHRFALVLLARPGNADVVDPHVLPRLLDPPAG